MSQADEMVAIAAMELAETGSVLVRVGPDYDLQRVHNMASMIAQLAGVEHINLMGAGPEHVRIMVDGGALVRIYRVLQLEARIWLVQHLRTWLDKLEG